MPHKKTTAGTRRSSQSRKSRTLEKSGGKEEKCPTCGSPMRKGTRNQWERDYDKQGAFNEQWGQPEESSISQGRYRDEEEFASGGRRKGRSEEVDYGDTEYYGNPEDEKRYLPRHPYR